MRRGPSFASDPVRRKEAEDVTLQLILVGLSCECTRLVHSLTCSAGMRKGCQALWVTSESMMRVRSATGDSSLSDHVRLKFDGTQDPVC